MHRQNNNERRPQVLPVPGIASFKKPSLRRQAHDVDNNKAKGAQTKMKEPGQVDYHKERYDEPSQANYHRERYDEASQTNYRRERYDKPSQENYRRERYDEPSNPNKRRERHDEPSQENYRREGYDEPSIHNKRRERYDEPSQANYHRERYNETSQATYSKERFDKPNQVNHHKQNYDKPSQAYQRKEKYDVHSVPGNEQFREHYDTHIRDKNYEDSQRSNANRRHFTQPTGSSFRRMETTSFTPNPGDPRGPTGYDQRRHSFDPRQQLGQRKIDPIEMRRSSFQSSSQAGPISQRVPILRNTRPIQTPTFKQISRRAGVFKSAEETFKEALKNKQPLPNIPINLRDKKRFLQQNDGTSFGENIVLPSVSSWHKVVTFLTDALAVVEPWSIALKHIEGTYGSGIGSYFRLLRTLLYINTFVALISFVFLILPVAIGNQISNLDPNFKFLDLFLGNGYLQDTILFYGAGVYTQPRANGYWKDFSVPKGYIYTTLAGYLVYLLITLANVVSAYKKSFIDSAESVGKKYGTAVFTAWEMTIEDKSSAQQLKDKICMDLKKLLKQRRAVVKMSKGIVLLRFLITSLVLGAIGGICYGIYQILEFSKNNKQVYVMPLALSGIVLLMPWLLMFVNKLGKYSSRHDLYVRLVETCLLVLSVLMVIRIYWWLNTEASIDVCRETRLGQDMYRLIIFYFLVIVLLSFAMETMWSMLYRCGVTFLGSPDFDISRNTTNLIYCQMVTCIGYYNSPMLPILTTVIFFLTFYIQRISLGLNYHSSKKTWTTSTTRTLYLIITFFAILFPFCLYVVTITVDVKSNCGPFEVGVPPIEVTGLNTESETVATWIFSGAIWGGITVGFMVLFYYIWSSASEQKRLGKTLLRELKSDKKELRQLQKECVKFITTD